MALTFEEQNAFNSGASDQANKGRKNPFSQKTQTELHDAWQSGWKAEEALHKAHNTKRKPA